MNKSSNNNNNNSRKANYTRIKQLGGVSDHQRVNLKYTMMTALTNVVTTGAFSYLFRANSVFDPDLTGTGGQPVNFDDYAGLYSYYRVWGSSIKVHIMPTTSGTEPTMWAVGPAHSTTAVSSANMMDFCAQPYVKSYLSAIYRTGAPDSVLSMSMSTAKYLGLSDSEFKGRDDCASLVSTNPTLAWFWKIGCINIDVAVTAEVAVCVELVYDVEFFDRIDPSLDFYARFDRMRSIVGHLEGRVGRASGLNSVRQLAPEGKHGSQAVRAPPPSLRLEKGVPPDEPESPGDCVIVVDPEPQFNVREPPSTRKRELQGGSQNNRSADVDYAPKSRSLRNTGA